MLSVPVTVVGVAVASEPAWISAPCAGCEAALIVRAGTCPALCNDCRKSQATAEARRLIQDAEDLIHGRGVYACLRIDERAEQLAQLFGNGWLRELSDSDLVDLIGHTEDAELMAEAADEAGRRIDARPLFAPAGLRLVADAPPAIERQRIELQDEQEHRGRTIEREIAESGVDEGFDGLYA